VAARADLTAFLREAAAAPFAFGEWDCAMTLANWVRLNTGIDPAPSLRGAYRSERGWKRIVIKAGGMVALVDRLASEAGLIRVLKPAVGDVAVIDVPSIGPAGAIRAERRWAMKFIGGLFAVDLPPVAVWGFR
jgi:hypothetical protein